MFFDKKLRKNKNEDANWIVAHWQDPNDKSMLIFRINAIDSIEELSHLFPARLGITVSVRSVEENLAILEQLEDEIEDFFKRTNLGILCVIISRIGGNQFREFMCYVPDKFDYQKFQEYLMKKFSSLEIRVYLEKDQNWDAYSLITERARVLFIIEKLIEAGSNPQKDHPIEFTILGNEAQLEEAAKLSLSQGYSKDEQQSEVGVLVMTKRLPLEADLVLNSVHEIQQIAAKCGVIYDGWASTIVK